MRLDNIRMNKYKILIKAGTKPQKFSACRYENTPGKKKKINVKIKKKIVITHGTTDILTLFEIEGILKRNLDK